MIRARHGASHDDGDALRSRRRSRSQQSGRESSPQRGAVSILITGDITKLMVAESLLRCAEIRYTTEPGPASADMLGLDRIGAGYNPLGGTRQILVEAGRAQEAVRLLETVDDDVC